MKPFTAWLLTAAVFTLATAASAGPGKGNGKGAGHGGMPDEFRGVIHELFANHDSFTRTVDLIDDGYRAKTVSKDPKKASLLQKHVRQMESRLDDGRGVRQWDPAFAELRQHYADMEVSIEEVKGGLVVEVTGKTPEAIAVARNHAKIIDGFIKKGSKQMHATHAAVLSDAETPAAKPACESCGKGGCQGGCGKGKGKGKGAGAGKGKTPCCENEISETQPPSSK